MRKAKIFAFVQLACFIFIFTGLERSAGAAFEIERPGARPAGMGGAFCAVADDADTMVYNPAGLGQIYSSTLAFNYVRLITGLDDGSLADSRWAYLQPIDDIGTFGITWYQRSLAELYQENIVALGYGLPLDEEANYLVGTSLKIFYQDFQDTEAISQNSFFANGSSLLGFGFDLGGIVYFTESLSAGLTLININQPNMSLGDSESILPLQIRIGSAFQQEGYLGTAELLMWSDSHYRFSTGGEAWWFDGLVGTRLGAAIGDRGMCEITAGLSLRWEQMTWIGQIDYAYINPLGEFSGAGGTHQFNLTFLFGAGLEDEDTLYARKLVKIGEQARLQGDFDKALQAWEEAAEVLTEDQVLAEKIATLREEIKREAEAKLYIKRGLEFEKSGNYLNAAAAYRKALAKNPGHVQASLLLKQVQTKIRKMSRQQKILQKRKEKRALQRVRQQSKKRAVQVVKKAEQALGQAQSNPRFIQLFPNDIKWLRRQMTEAKKLLTTDESDRALVLAQTIIEKIARFNQRVTRIERAKARKKRRSKKTRVHSKSAATKLAVDKSPVAKSPVLQSTVAKAKSSTDKKMRKRARGAYGRVVKMMLDIDKLNGEKYFPKQVGIYKKELARVKVLLKSEDYAATIRYAQKLYPKLQKLKKDCVEKEKARRAMPTNW